MQVLITRAAAQSQQFGQSLTPAGIQVWDMPTLEIQPPSSYAALDRAIQRLSTFHWLVFTSANGVDFFLERLQNLGLDADALSTCKLAAVGRKTAQALATHGLSADFVPPDFQSSAIAPHFPDRTAATTTRILYPCLETGCRDAWVGELQALGYTVELVATYESGCPKTVPIATLTALDQGIIDIATFASPKTAIHFRQILVEQLGEAATQRIIQGLKIAAIGPVTAVTCVEQFGKVDMQPEEYTIEGMTTAILAVYIAVAPVG